MKREPWNPLLKTYPESRKINAVSVEAEAMFCRLLALCDDHANYYGTPRLLLTHLWGHRWANGTMSLRKCTRCRNELIVARLVDLYRPDGAEYLHVVNCKKMLRSDIKEDVRFPEVAQVVDPQEFIESVSDAVRIRAGFGSSCVVPSSTSVAVDVAVSVDSPTYTDDFLAFWKAYPRRVGKGEAFKVWQRIKNRPDVAVLVAAVEAQAKSEQWTKDDGQFIPHPRTWLNQRRWEDDVEKAGSKSNVRRKEGEPDRDLHPQPYRKAERVGE